MLISLQLLRTPQGPVDNEPVRSFEDEQVTIGRAPNCHVVLPDGLRIISRQHARLNVQDGAVLLTCLSASAPVRVNDLAVPHGGVLALRSGDVIHIGGFALVLVAAARPARPGAGAVPLNAGAAPGLAGPVSLPPAPAVTAFTATAMPVLPGGVVSPPAPRWMPTPAPSLEAPAPRPAGRGRLDDWFDLDPVVVPDPPVPMAAGPTLAASHPPSPAGWAATAEVDLDLRSGAFAPNGQPAARASATSAAQVAPVPRPAPAAAPAAVRAAPARQSLAGAPDLPARAGVPSAATPSGAPSAVTASARHAASQGRDDADGLADDAGSQPGFASLDDLRAALMQAFLEGAGLGSRPGATSTQMLPPMALTPAWMRRIGELLRASVEGSLALLHSRSTVKREMRAEVTVIARRQNNPLKFAPDALAALAHLVAAKRSPGFLEPVAALKDAHEDLLVHHLAVVAGMRAAMFELISRLGPEDVLRDEGPPKGLSLALPTRHEAALWRRYRQRHADMIARLDDDFETVFGREFTKAYEAQARRVREKAPPEDTSA